ncbi:MAG: class I SAM-dependent methyltransferase [Planctomycetes bacterium]|jgi:SAM-dependent methyltransferase|nr:class I SAM-dependent methyltransferase [Planctomycetota bacterium]
MAGNAHEFYLAGKDYDLISGHGVPGDVEYFSKLAKKAGRVLELACGTGRVTLPMLKTGARVTGLDLVPAMLDVAREKASALDASTQARLELLKGNMRRFELGEKFPLIVIPFRAFQHLLEVKDQRACLECCREHLTRQGRLVIDIFDPNLRIIANQMQPGLPGPVIKTVVEEVEGGKAIVWISRSLSPERQVMREEWVLERFDSAGNSISRRLHTLTLRWFYRFEMEHLFELCGLKVIKLEGGFAGQPFAHGGEQLWTVAR